jgi:hypothetical protein
MEQQNGKFECGRANRPKGGPSAASPKPAPIGQKIQLFLDLKLKLGRTACLLIAERHGKNGAFRLHPCPSVFELLKPL